MSWKFAPIGRGGNLLYSKAGTPALDLRFAENKSLNDFVSGNNLITFSRASSGTYFDQNGVLQTAPAGVARFDHDPETGESLGLLVEEARTNRTVRSQRLGLSTGNWFTYKANCIDNSGLAPDGTFTAARLVPNTENLIHYVADGTGASLSGTATISVFAKADGYNFILLSFDYASGDGLFPGSAYFDLSTGQIALGASTTGSIQQFPNGWYRCTITATSGSTVQANPFVVVANSLSNFNFAGNGTSGILLWGFQFESGSFPTSYIPTPATFTSRSTTATYYDANGVIQTAAINVARDNAYFPDENGVMRPAGLLLEAAGTNLLTYSQEFDNASWTTANATTTANAVTSPDGSATAESLLETTANGSHFITQLVTTTSARHTVTFFVKANGRDRLAIGGNASLGGNLGAGIFFELSTNSYVSGGASGAVASVQVLSNGWKRISYSWDALASTGALGIFLVDSGTNISYVGDASKGVYIWGAQLEAGSYPTSYIPTTTAAVTRAADVSTSAAVTRSADVAQITGSNFSSWYNQNEGTAFCNFVPQRGNTVEAWAAQFGNTQLTGPNSIVIGKVSSNLAYAETRINSVTQYFGSLSVPTGSMRVAYGVKNLDHRSAFNGQLASAGSGSFGPLSDNVLLIGRNVATTQLLGGTISRLTYYPVRLADSVLQTITQ